MITIYDLKSRFQALLRPGNQWLVKRGLTANHITLLALILSLAAGIAIACFPAHRWPFLLLPLVLFIRMALNAIDGMLAREHGMASPLGAILNELGDVISDTALYLPFALVAGLPSFWVIIIVVMAIMSEMTGIIAVQIGTARRYDGPMGKSDRAFAFGLLAFLLGIGVMPGLWSTIYLIIVALLLLLTIINRARQALKDVS